MANHFSASLCLIGAMDRLWFHQIILFSEPISHSLAYPLISTLSSPPFPDEQISSATSLLPDEEISLDSSPTSPPEIDSNNEDDGISKRSARLHLIRYRNRNGSDSSPSPSTQSRTSKNLRNSGGINPRRLNKSMSCKSLGELELEEVKGFMDLGFIFKKEQLSPRMMSLVPGLQRLNDIKEAVKDDESEEGNYKEKIVVVRRPYLSEAWFIKRSDSPLLNLRMPIRAVTHDDMKKHIRFWARTVASVVQQES